MKKSSLHIGTSGWSYNHWKESFYPKGLPVSKHFEYYQAHFDTVEINNSFYRLPSPETFSAWKNAAKPNFRFAVKANRYLTHAKKLIVDPDSIRRFFTSVNKMEDKLAVILFQLPPRWKVNPQRLKTFIEALPKEYRYAFEFREPGWYNEEVYAILKAHNCAFCIYELGGHLSPIKITAPFVYVRLHGPGNKYQGSYSRQSLLTWADRIRKWQKAGLDIFIYFDNDEAAYAIQNALALKQLCEASYSARRRSTSPLNSAKKSS